MIHRRLRYLAALSALAVGAAAGVCASVQGQGGTPQRPQRIVSLNLCTDQLVLALADRDQIAGLTRNATDRGMSAEAARANGLPILGASAEQMLAIDPDLVIGMPASMSPGVQFLPAGHARLLDMESAESLDQIIASIRTVATAVDHPARGEALVASMQHDLATIPRNGAGKVAVQYQRRGYVTGTGTLIDDLMTRAGLVNLSRKLGKPVLSQMSLEEMVAARPDYLIVERSTEKVNDQGSEMLHHPALRGIHRISIPQAWTVCGGLAYVKAARAIAEQTAHR